MMCVDKVPTVVWSPRCVYLFLKDKVMIRNPRIKPIWTFPDHGTCHRRVGESPTMLEMTLLPTLGYLRNGTCWCIDWSKCVYWLVCHNEIYPAHRDPLGPCTPHTLLLDTRACITDKALSHRAPRLRLGCEYFHSFPTLVRILVKMCKCFLRSSLLLRSALLSTAEVLKREKK